MVCWSVHVAQVSTSVAQRLQELALCSGWEDLLATMHYSIQAMHRDCKRALNHFVHCLFCKCSGKVHLSAAALLAAGVLSDCLLLPLQLPSPIPGGMMHVPSLASNPALFIFI